MGIAQEIWQAFIRAHPEVLTGHLSLQDINRTMAAFIQDRNQQLQLDFTGLSPQQMYILLNEPWGAGSMLRLKSPLTDEVLDQIPFFNLMQLLYEHLLTRSSLKLTPKGNLPLALCRSLYERRLLVQDDIESGITKQISEDNVRFLQALKACLCISRFVKKKHNALWLTKAGQLHQRHSRTDWLVALLQDFTLRFNWGYLDGAQTSAGQFGWAYSLYLLCRYGVDWQPAGFYAAKVLKAFPQFEEPITTSGGWSVDFENVYRWRVLEHFGSWFGLVELRPQPQAGVYPVPLQVRKSPLLDALFSFSG